MRINVRTDSSARDKSRAVIQAHDWSRRDKPRAVIQAHDWSRRADFLCADSETKCLTGISRADGRAALGRHHHPHGSNSVARGRHGRRDDVRPHLHVGDWGGDGHGVFVPEHVFL